MRKLWKGAKRVKGKRGRERVNDRVSRGDRQMDEENYKQVHEKL